MSKKIEQPKISDAVITELLSQVNPQEIFSKDGLIAQLKKKLVERVMQSELDHELDYSKHSKQPKNTSNRRNGSYNKTVIDANGEKLDIDVPRDRDSEYEPQIVPKGIRRLKDFDNHVISLYARGLTMSEMQGNLKETYHTAISKDLM